MNNYDETIVSIFETAAGKAFTALIEEHRDEHFYYFALLNDGNWRPYISAWSYEALEHFYEENEVVEEEKSWYKWTGVESPYEAYGWDEYFAGYADFLQEREQEEETGEDESTDDEWILCVNTMEEAMKRLDKKGIFGTGDVRDKVVIAVEIVPPAKANYNIAARLNDKGLIKEFLKENAGLLEEETDY